MNYIAAGQEADGMLDAMGVVIAALRAGTICEYRPLSGGSETRRDDAAGIIASYQAIGIKAERIGGCMVRIGN